MGDKVTIHDLRAMKERGERITMLTAYDYPTAMLIDRAGIDIALVGDSLGMVVHGLDTTLPVKSNSMPLTNRTPARLSGTGPMFFTSRNSNSSSLTASPGGGGAG